MSWSFVGLPLYLMSTLLQSGWGSWGFSHSGLSYLLGLVVCLSFFICVGAGQTMYFLILITSCASLVFFVTDSPIILYVLFEASIFPVVIMILFFGNTFERFEACYFLIFFSSLSIYPSMTMLFFVETGCLSLNFFISPLWSLFFVGAFLVKLPLYFLHYWLPKAHVEAPSIGSMVLAGLLLKLGGWGIVRMMSFLIVSNYLYPLLMTLLLGAILGPLWASLHSDSKGLVAFSSISHMNFSVLALLLGSSISKPICVLVFLTHDVISSIMFWLMGLMYHLSFSRQILFLFGLDTYNVFLGGWVMIFFLSNFGVPPFLSFFHELIIINCYFSYSFSSCVVVFLYSMFVCYYSLFLLLNLFVFKNSSVPKNTSLEGIIIFSSSMFMFVPFLLWNIF